jgi:hypothetical protein
MSCEMSTRRRALTEAEKDRRGLGTIGSENRQERWPGLGVDDETLVGEGSYEIRKNACTWPSKSLAQSRNVGSSDPMARSGQGGVRIGGPDLGSDAT